MKTTLKNALAVIEALREYVEAISPELAAQLPAMPGIDGFWMDDTESQLKNAIGMLPDSEESQAHE